MQGESTKYFAIQYGSPFPVTIILALGILDIYLGVEIRGREIFTNSQPA